MTKEELIASFEQYRSPGSKYPGDKRFSSVHPEEARFLLELTPKCLNFPLLARLSLVRQGKDQPNLCYCGKNWVRWSSWNNDWNATCSRKCAANSPEALEKKKQTCLERYNVESPSQTEPVKARYRSTCLERYGVEYANQSEEIQARTRSTCLERYGVEYSHQIASVREKFKTTMLERYGVEFPSQSKEIRSKIAATCKRRYGVKRYSQTAEWVTRVKATNLKRLGVEHTFQSLKVQAKSRETRFKLYGSWNSKNCCYSEEILEKITSEEFWYQKYVVESKSIFDIAIELNASNTINGYFHLYSGLKLRRGTSAAEGQLANFISQFQHIETQFSLGRQFLDIYIPELKLAFEYNGIYWHSSEFKDKDYHIQKTLACEKRGIRLIHIWEDDWVNKQELMKRKIKSILGVSDRKVFARKCTILVPTKEQKRSFYEQNHVKGNGGGSIDYALEYQDELVAMITFKLTDSGYDLTRYATSCSVPGGFSRLLEHFKRNNPWSRIYTYADRSWSQGDVYLKCGFRLMYITEPNFHGVENSKQRNHLNYTHTQLQKRFPDLEGTKFEIMDQAGIKRIWDCGQLKFEMFNT
jgi:very-short-patch-repair endonuclease